MTDQLKPCPFCGRPPKADMPNCPNGFCYCECMNTRYFSHQGWNSRPAEERLRAALEWVIQEAEQNWTTYGKHPVWEGFRAACKAALKPEPSEVE